MTLEFWFDFASTYSYPAAMRVEALAAERQVPVVWRCFLLGPIFRQNGWTDSPFNLYPQKGRYMWHDLARSCQALQLPLRQPSVFPRVALTAARIACAYADAPWLPAFVRAVYQANFVHDHDITDAHVIANVLQDCGLDPQPILNQAQSPAAKEQLRAQTALAQQLDIFGAPFMRCDDEPFWGHDRLEQALDYAAQHAASR